MTHAPVEALHDLAHRHLPPDDATRWIGLLAPGLRRAHAGDGPVAGRLGGLPELPLGLPWPTWEGHGPLSHIASLDCAALAAAGDCGLALPDSGTLLFFLHDGRPDGGDSLVHASDPGTRPGAQVLHVPAGTPPRPHPAPPELPAYDLADVELGYTLAGRPAPGPERPVRRRPRFGRPRGPVPSRTRTGGAAPDPATSRSHRHPSRDHSRNNADWK